MKDFFALTRISLLQMFGAGKYRQTDKKKLSRTILMTVLYGFLLLMGCAYSGGFSYLMCSVGLSGNVLGMMLAASGILCFITAAFRYTGLIGNARDREFLLSLPISPNVIVLSRFFEMYLMDFAFAALILVPAMIVYTMFVPVGLWFFVSFFLMLFFAPLLPMALAVPFGMLIGFIASRMKHKSVFQSIFSFVFFILIMLWSFSGGSSNEEQMTGALTAVSGPLASIYFPAGWFTEALAGNLWSFVWFLVSSVGLFTLAAFFAGRGFLKLSNALNRETTHGKLSGDVYRKRSPFSALLAKETRRYFSCSIWLLNTGLSPIMLLLIAIMLCVFPSETLATALEMPEFSAFIGPLLPFVMCMICGLGGLTSSSISLEGNSRFSLAALPLRAKTIYDAKIALNLWLLVPACLVSGCLFVFGMHLSGFSILFVFLMPMVYSCFTAVFGLFANLKFPKFDYITETQVVKQSAAAGLSIFPGMIFPILPVVALFFLGFENTLLVSGIFSLLCALLTVVLYRHLIRRPFPV